MNTPENPPPRQSFCQRLRSKEMYHSRSGGTEDEFASGVYWCMKTQEAFGPDGEPAGKTECCPGRSCYLG